MPNGPSYLKEQPFPLCYSISQYFFKLPWWESWFWHASKFDIYWSGLVVQLCPAFCDPMDCSPPDSSVHEILQARILEWVAIPFSRGSSWSKDGIWVFCIEADSSPSEPPGKPMPHWTAQNYLESLLTAYIFPSAKKTLYFFIFYLKNFPNFIEI